MRGYIINLSLNDTDPPVYRQVILPERTTFNRLHDTIQNVTNFLSGYPYFHRHLYTFDLPEEDQVVTNDEERYLEHKDYLKNKQWFEDRLNHTPRSMRRYEEKNLAYLRKTVKLPERNYIDHYLENYKTMTYLYDYGAGWEFTITLEAVVDDYYFGYPTLLEAENDAPPEDVAGVEGFYRFLEAYYNPSDPEHKQALIFGKKNGFRPLDFDYINEGLKGIKYRKTEWEHINHDHYNIIGPRYIKK